MLYSIFKITFSQTGNRSCTGQGLRLRAVSQCWQGGGEEHWLLGLGRGAGGHCMLLLMLLLWIEAQRWAEGHYMLLLLRVEAGGWAECDAVPRPLVGVRGHEVGEGVDVVTDLASRPTHQHHQQGGGLNRGHS